MGSADAARVVRRPSAAADRSPCRIGAVRGTRAAVLGSRHEAPGAGAAGNALPKEATMTSDSRGRGRSITRRAFVGGAAALPLVARGIGRVAAQPVRSK